MENIANNLNSKLKTNENTCEETAESEGEYFSDSYEDTEDITTQKVVHNVDDDQDVIDEATIIENEKQMDESLKEQRKLETLRLKDLGNAEFKNCSYQEAVKFYTDAISICLLIHNEERAILYSNRSAAFIKLLKDSDALADCEKAVKLNPSYVRARLRRAELYEKTDELEKALEDYKTILQQDPGQHAARAACMRLPDLIKVRNDKMKDEMIDKLKDLGNMILRPFGLSTENFKMQQDPSTGSYSVNFQQNSSRNT